jgi:uncharacterized protein (DUF3084 family)
MHFKSLLLMAGAALLGVANLSAQAPNTLEQRLREQLKSLAGQLHTAEADKAALQADKTALEDKLKTAEKNLADLTKKMEVAATTATKAQDKLKGELADKEKELEATKNDLIKADQIGKQNAASSMKFEAESKKLAGENRQLKDVVAGQRTRNRKMYEIATDILDRYSKFGLGTALTAREPFVGITRARPETMVEELGSDLDAQRIKIGGGTASPPSSTKGRPADGPPGKKERPASKP